MVGVAVAVVRVRGWRAADLQDQHFATVLTNKKQRFRATFCNLGGLGNLENGRRVDCSHVVWKLFQALLLVSGVRVWLWLGMPIRRLRTLV